MVLKLRKDSGGGSDTDSLTFGMEFIRFASRSDFLPRRLTARQQTLDLFIEVRILAGQQIDEEW